MKERTKTKEPSGLEQGSLHVLTKNETGFLKVEEETKKK